MVDRKNSIDHKLYLSIQQILFLLNKVETQDLASLQNQLKNQSLAELLQLILKS